MINLDMKCAFYARELVERHMTGKSGSEQENIVQKALGVLLENGPYAMYIFCESNKKKGFSDVNKCLNDLLADEDIRLGAGNSFESQLESIAVNLDTLLFARDLMERTLTYARYHAKAKA